MSWEEFSPLCECPGFVNRSQPDRHFSYPCSHLNAVRELAEEDCAVWKMIGRREGRGEREEGGERGEGGGRGEGRERGEGRGRREGRGEREEGGEKGEGGGRGGGWLLC